MSVRRTAVKQTETRKSKAEASATWDRNAHVTIAGRPSPSLLRRSLKRQETRTELCKPRGPLISWAAMVCWLNSNFILRKCAEKAIGTSQAPHPTDSHRVFILCWLDSSSLSALTTTENLAVMSWGVPGSPKSPLSRELQQVQYWASLTHEPMDLFCNATEHYRRS